LQALSHDIALSQADRLATIARPQERPRDSLNKTEQATSRRLAHLVEQIRLSEEPTAVQEPVANSMAEQAHQTGQLLFSHALVSSTGQEHEKGGGVGAAEVLFQAVEDLLKEEADVGRELSDLGCECLVLAVQAELLAGQ
jgi:hypothetical protein